MKSQSRNVIKHSSFRNHLIEVTSVCFYKNGSLDQVVGDKLKHLLLSESESRVAIQLTLSSVLYTILHSAI